MSDIKIIEVKQSVFADNNADAEKLRESLKKENTFLLNIIFIFNKFGLSECQNNRSVHK